MLGERGWESSCVKAVKMGGGSVSGGGERSPRLKTGDQSLGFGKGEKETHRDEEKTETRRDLH